VDAGEDVPTAMYKAGNAARIPVTAVE